MKKTLILKTEEETEALGRQLAQAAGPGDVIALSGDLGAGKTTLARAVARGLGVEGPVTSPTFNLLNIYEQGRLPLYHFDVYRVHQEEELHEIGFFEYLDGQGLCLVEWADLVEDLLPPRTLWVQLTREGPGQERSCIISHDSGH